jgi:hypothetical protein
MIFLVAECRMVLGGFYSNFFITWACFSWTRILCSTHMGNLWEIWVSCQSPFLVASRRKLRRPKKEKKRKSLLSSELQLFLWFETKHHLHSDLRKYQLTSVVCRAEEKPERNCGFKIVKICAFLGASSGDISMISDLKHDWYFGCVGVADRPKHGESFWWTSNLVQGEIRLSSAFGWASEVDDQLLIRRSYRDSGPALATC